MKAAPEAPDVQAHCRSLALQQIEMLTRIAEIGMRLVEAEGAKAIAQAELTGQPQAGALGTDTSAAADHGLAFGRHARTVHWALALRGRTADRLCAQDKAARKVRRARHRNQVCEAMHSLIWHGPQPLDSLDDAEHRTVELEARLDALYGDEDDPVEERPVGSVIAGLACGLNLADAWRHRAADWSDPPHPPPPTGTPAEVRERQWARVVALVGRPFICVDPDLGPAMAAGLAARLQEPDAAALIDSEPPARAAERLCRSVGLDFTGWYAEPDVPDTG